MWRDRALTILTLITIISTMALDNLTRINIISTLVLERPPITDGKWTDGYIRHVEPSHQTTLLWVRITLLDFLPS